MPNMAHQGNSPTYSVPRTLQEQNWASYMAYVGNALGSAGMTGSGLREKGLRVQGVPTTPVTYSLIGTTPLLVVKTHKAVGNWGCRYGFVGDQAECPERKRTWQQL